MPVHDFRCPQGHVFEAFVGQGQDSMQCPWHLEAVAEKVFLKAPMGFVQRDICYDSPIDGKPITSKQARIEDLRRNNCVEYDPGMRQDFERNLRDADAELDRSVDATVEEWAAKAGSRKLEKLEQEVRAGADTELARNTT